jgi:hypothetical protein
MAAPAALVMYGIRYAARRGSLADSSGGRIAALVMLRRLLERLLAAAGPAWPSWRRCSRARRWLSCRTKDGLKLLAVIRSTAPPASSRRRARLKYLGEKSAEAGFDEKAKCSHGSLLFRSRLSSRQMDGVPSP